MSLPRYAILFCLPVLFLAACARPIAPDPVDREIENLRAFAKLYGYVRWFHPSAEAVTTDWNAFAVDGVGAVRGARDADELRDTLIALFAPVADGVELFAAPPPPHEPEARCEHEYAWQHLGFGSSSMYRSVIARRDGALIDASSFPSAHLRRGLPVEELRGRTLRIRANGASSAPGSAFIVVGYMSQSASRPWYRQDWLRHENRRHELVVDMPEDLADATLYLTARGMIDARFGPVELALRSENDWRPLTVPNLDFVAGADGWTLEGRGAYGLDFVESDGVTHAHVSSRYEVGMRAFDVFPEPGESHVAQLAQGLWTRIPLTTCSPPAVVDVDDATPPPADSSDVRAAAVIAAWNALQHFYPYFDVVDVDWDAELTAALRGALGATTFDDADRVLLRLVAAVGDGHGDYIRPGMAEMRAPPVGVEVVEGEVVVTVSRSEAVKVGDRVVSVDGTPALSHLEGNMRLVSGSPQWKRHVAGRRWFAVGAADTTVRLRIDRDGQEFDVDVARDGGVWRGGPEPVRAPIEQMEPGIWYVDIGRVHPPDFLARAAEFDAATGFVLDMRGYPADWRGSILAHFTDERLYSPRFSVSHTIRPDRQGNEWEFAQWHVEPEMPRLHARVAMLIGGGALSAAETVAGLAAFHGLAEMVGEPTGGANGNVAGFQVPDGGRIQFTGVLTRNQDGSELHLRGIQPTVPVERTIAGVRAGRDEVLERALEVIKAGR